MLVQFIDRISEVVSKIIKIIICLMASLLVIVNIAQIMGRYVFFYSLPWSEELSVWLFLSVIFLGLGLSVRSKSEITIELITIKSPRGREIQEIIQHILALLATIILLVSSVALTKQAIQFGQKTSALKLSYSIIYGLMVTGFFLSAFEKIILISKSIKKLSKRGGDMS